MHSWTVINWYFGANRDAPLCCTATDCLVYLVQDCDFHSSYLDSEHEFNQVHVTCIHFDFES